MTPEFRAVRMNEKLTIFQNDGICHLFICLHFNGRWNWKAKGLKFNACQASFKRKWQSEEIVTLATKIQACNWFAAHDVMASFSNLEKGTKNLYKEAFKTTWLAVDEFRPKGC